MIGIFALVTVTSVSGLKVSSSSMTAPGASSIDSIGTPPASSDDIDEDLRLEKKADEKEFLLRIELEMNETLHKFTAQEIRQQALDLAKEELDIVSEEERNQPTWTKTAAKQDGAYERPSSPIAESPFWFCACQGGAGDGCNDVCERQCVYCGEPRTDHKRLGSTKEGLITVDGRLLEEDSDDGNIYDGAILDSNEDDGAILDSNEDDGNVGLESVDSLSRYHNNVPFTNGLVDGQFTEPSCDSSMGSKGLRSPRSEVGSPRSRSPLEPYHSPHAEGEGSFRFTPESDLVTNDRLSVSDGSVSEIGENQTFPEEDPQDESETKSLLPKKRRGGICFRFAKCSERDRSPRCFRSATQ